jgi:hypothetical protein
MQTTISNEFETIIQALIDYGNRIQSDTIRQSSMVRELMERNQEESIYMQKKNMNMIIMKQNEDYMSEMQ